MKKILLSTVLLTLAMPAFASPKTITGKLVNGGGLDDMTITVKPAHGKEVDIYCNKDCGDWFESGVEPSNDEVQGLKKAYKNKKVRVTYNYEKNNDRVAGPSNDEKFNFAKKITFLR